MEKSEAALFASFKLNEGQKEKESPTRKKAPKEKQIKFVMVDQYGKTIKKKDIIAAMKGEKTKSSEAFTGIDATYLAREAERERERKESASKSKLKHSVDSTEDLIPSTGKLSRRKITVVDGKGKDQTFINDTTENTGKGKGKGIDTIVNALLNIKGPAEVGIKQESEQSSGRVPSIASMIDTQFSSGSYESTLLSSKGKGLKRPASPTHSMDSQRFNAPSLRDLAGPLAGHKEPMAAPQGHYGALSSLSSGMHAPSSRVPGYHHHHQSSPRLNGGHYPTLGSSLSGGGNGNNGMMSGNGNNGMMSGSGNGMMNGNGNNSMMNGNGNNGMMGGSGPFTLGPSLSGSLANGGNPVGSPMSFPVTITSSLSMNNLMTSSSPSIIPASNPVQHSASLTGSSLTGPSLSLTGSSLTGPSLSLNGTSASRGFHHHQSPSLVASTPCYNITQSSSVLSDVDSVPISRGTSWIDQLLSKD